MINFINTTSTTQHRSFNGNIIRRSATVLFATMLIMSVIWGSGLLSRCFVAYAEDETYPIEKTNKGYVTESFVVNMDVDKDCVYNVTEKIIVNFQEPKRGIFRYIPYQNSNSRIDDIEVEGETVDISFEANPNGHMVKILRIGDEDKFLTGRHEYTIKYKIIGTENDLKPISKASYQEGFSGFLSNRPINKGKEDLIYVDLIPSEWETGINYVKATINLPKDVDWNNFKLYGGKYGSDTESENVTSTFDGRTATFEAVNWAPYSGITLYGNVGEGYWEGVEKASGAFRSIYVIAILFALIIFALWFFFGRDRKYTKTVEFYPPDNMTPMEVGYVVDGAVDNEDRVSNFVYAASRGYMDIEQDSHDEKKFTFRKKENYDKKQFENEKSFVRLFVNNLFATKEEVDSDHLPEPFLRDFRNGDKMMKDYYDGVKKPFTHSSMMIQGFSALMFIVLNIYIYVFTVEDGVYSAGSGVMFITALFEIITSIVLLIISINFVYRQKNISRKKISKYVTVLLAIGAVNLILNGIFYFIHIGIPTLGIVVILCKIISYITIALMSKRSKYSSEIMGKLMGFRVFIEKAELPMIKSLVEEDPAYFYKILPYAYVFGLTTKWIKNFEGLKIDPPGWYHSGNYNMSNMAFPLYMASSLNTLNSGINASIMDAVKSSSDVGGGGIGGGFSGGGFSGGGFGGGGGGAW